MSDTKVPRAIPLPEVGLYTDDVIIGNLGLPVGFDDERLLVNIRGINRIRAVAGLGTISIVGERGDTSSYDYNVTSMDSSGTATFGAVSKQRKEPRAQGNVSFPTPSSSFNNPDVTIQVNTAERDERIKQKQGISGLYEPKFVAKELNAAIKQGVTSAAIDANMDKEKLKVSARVYGFFGSIGLIGGGGVPRALAVGMVAGPALANLSVLRNATFQQMIDKNVNPLEVWKEYRQSLFVGLSPDRMLVANGLIKTSRFIKHLS